jgi:hypothetical protein
VNAVELLLPPLPADASEQDLASALGVVIERDGQLFTAGEVLVLERARGLSPPGRALLARCSSVVCVRSASRTSSTPPCPTPARRARAVSQGLADDETVLPVRLGARGLPERQRSPRSSPEHGALATGVRATLASACDGDPPVPSFASHSCASATRALFARVARLFLYDDDDDLRRVVLARIGVFRYPTYEPTGGPGRSAIDVAARVRGALARLQSVDESDRSGALATAALDACERPGTMRSTGGCRAAASTRRSRSTERASSSAAVPGITRC